MLFVTKTNKNIFCDPSSHCQATPVNVREETSQDKALFIAQSQATIQIKAGT
jgi:hypothetical protein